LKGHQHWVPTLGRWSGKVILFVLPAAPVRPFGAQIGLWPKPTVPAALHGPLLGPVAQVPQDIAGLAKRLAETFPEQAAPMPPSGIRPLFGRSRTSLIQDASSCF